jgi:hypothetical protein
MLFGYATLLEGETLAAIVGFIFSFGFLLLIYGHHFDAFYFHIGNRIKLGGEAYDPDRAEKVEVEQKK